MADKERFTVSGDQLVSKVKQLIQEGNIRKVRIIHQGEDLAGGSIIGWRPSGSNWHYSCSGSGCCGCSGCLSN